MSAFSDKSCVGVVIYGAGGHARELSFQLKGEGIRVAAFVDDFEPNRTVRDIPVLDFPNALDRFSSLVWHVAIGETAARATLLSRLIDSKIALGGFVSKAALIAPSARIAPTAQVFSGCVVSDGVSVGNHVIINFNATVSHDVCIGDETIVSPRVAIAGNVSIGRQVFLGIGATVRNGKPLRPLVIGDNVVVGAGACVTGDVASHATVVGVPARKIRERPR